MKVLRNYGLLVLWLLTIAAMVRDYYVVDPVDPTLEGTAAYGHNADGTLFTMVLFTAIELAVLHGLLRPWTASRPGQRVLARIGWVLPLVVVWTFMSAVLMMHAGGVVVLHTLWLLAVIASLIIAFIVTVIARLQRSR